MSFTATPCQTVGYAYPLENVLYYDFVNNYATAPHASAYDFDIGDPFSVELWFAVGALNHNNASGDYKHAIIGKNIQGGGALTGWGLEINSDFKATNKRALNFFFQDNTTADRLLKLYANRFPNDISDIKHVIATYDGSNTIDGLNVYIDGVLVAADTEVDSGNVASIATTDPLGLGLSRTAIITDKNRNQYFEGNIHIARLYDKELNSTEVTYCYNCKNPSPPLRGSNLAAEWLVSEIAPSTVADTSGNGNDVTTSGFVASDFLNSVTGEQASNEATC